MAETETKVADRIVYAMFIGHRRYTSKKDPTGKNLTTVFLDVGKDWKNGKGALDEDSDDDETVLLFGEKIGKIRSDRTWAIGDVLELPMARNTAMFGDAKHIGECQDESKVARWQAQHHAARTAVAAEKETSKRIMERLDLKALEPFRTAYWRASAIERAAIIASIVKYVVR